MAFNNEMFSDLQPRLKSWLQIDDESSFITSTSLDLLNRAQNWLVLYKPWSTLQKRSVLTVTNKVASAPSDFAYELQLYSKPSDNNAPTVFYYREKRRERGYEIVDSFDKSTGHAPAFTFYTAPSFDVYLLYIRTLEDFTGTGDEYTFFPGEMLLNAAKFLHASEMGMDMGEISQIKSALDETIQMYIKTHQYANAELRMQVNDEIGNPLDIASYNMLGSEPSITNSCANFDRDYDCGL